MDRTGLTWYTGNMAPGPKPKPKEELYVLVGVKLPPEIVDEIEKIVKKTPRTTKSLVARSLLFRGLQEYRVDRRLNSPARRRKNSIVPGGEAVAKDDSQKEEDNTGTDPK